MSSLPVIVVVVLGTPTASSLLPAYTGFQSVALHTAKLCALPSVVSEPTTVITGSAKSARFTLKSTSKLL